jgi:hypothetical protein
MAKCEPVAVRKRKKEWAEARAKRTREFKREAFKDAMAKEKVETSADLIGLFYGLSRRAIEQAAYARILQLAALGKTPVQIVDLLDPPKKSKEPII